MVGVGVGFREVQNRFFFFFLEGNKVDILVLDIFFGLRNNVFLLFKLLSLGGFVVVFLGKKIINILGVRSYIIFIFLFLVNNFIRESKLENYWFFCWWGMQLIENRDVRKKIVVILVINMFVVLRVRVGNRLISQLEFDG